MRTKWRRFDQRAALQLALGPQRRSVMVEERAAAFTKRSIKTSAKLAGLKARRLDDGPDHSRRQRYAGESRFPLPESDAAARSALRRAVAARRFVFIQISFASRRNFSAVPRSKLPRVATAFPTGLMPLKLKLQEVRSAARMARMRSTW